MANTPETPPTETAKPIYHVSLTGQAPVPETDNTLWYRAPATFFEEALPLGSGQLGVMVYGGIDEDRLGLNKDTLYAGGPYDPVNPDAIGALPEIRKLIFEDRGTEAVKLITDKFLARPVRQMPYQAVGDLIFRRTDITEASNYIRQLNLDTAVATTEFDSGGVHYTRETFASFPRNVIATRYSANQPGKISFTASFDSVLPSASQAGNGLLILTGQNTEAHENPSKLAFEARARFIVKHGTSVFDGNKITISNADEVVVFLVINTSYRRYDDVSGNPSTLNTELLRQIEEFNFDQLRDENSQEYQAIFRRVKINLGPSRLSHLPTDERLKAATETDDPGLASLYYQYGRYLLISCSRGLSQPANLQGVWNKSLSPPWGCKYTININTEMNYWHVDSTNLDECLEPLVRMVEEMSITGALTARTMYGTGGWVAHHNTELWRATAAIDGPNYGTWPTGGAWLCQNLYEHYLYSLDENYLRRIFPLMKGAALFFEENLLPDPTGKWLVTNPSMSPENPHHPGVAVCYGPAMDNQILRDLFNNCIQASQVLNIDQAMQEKWKSFRDRLPPDLIGKQGQLQEWIADWDSIAPDQKHRHISHLYGLFPSCQIDPITTPELADAARVTLDHRGDITTGWAIAWRINCWARLHDGERAHSIVRLLLDPSRTYPNLFDAHPPFQIDGNFGGTSGITEMLLQSHNNQIHVLPALPRAWKTGSVSGLRARGNFEIDIQWRDGALVSANMKSNSGTVVNVRLGNQTKSIPTRAGQTITIDQNLNVV